MIAWLKSVSDADLHLPAVAIGELQAGIEITREQDAEKAAEIEAWLDQVADTYNVLAMGTRAFRCWARFMHGRSDTVAEDAMIAATAEVNNMTVVTRNVRDFRPFGVKTLNPFVGERS